MRSVIQHITFFVLLVPVWGFVTKKSFTDDLIQYVHQKVQSENIDQVPDRVLLPRIVFPNFSIEGIKTNYHHLDPDSDLQFLNITIVPILNTLNDEYVISYKLKKGHVKKRLYSTLCSGDARCSASSFTLIYNLRTNFVTVENGNQNFGLLKYNFDREVEEPFSHKDIEDLNCLLRTELHKPDSYLWDFEGVEKYDDDTEKLKIDGFSGATSLNKSNNLECQPPDGGLWTTLTVFAHAYEFGHQVRRWNVDDWAEQLEKQQKEEMYSKWVSEKWFDRN